MNVGIDYEFKTKVTLQLEQALLIQSIRMPIIEKKDLIMEFALSADAQGRNISGKKTFFEK